MSLLILAGGRGRRMSSDGQGIDKGLVLLNGKPLVRHVFDRLAKQLQGPHIVNCNANLEQYTAALPADTVFISDARNDSRGVFSGPLAGIEAALAICTTQWLLVAPCDTPFVPDNLLMTLWQQIQPANLPPVDVVIAKDPEQAHHVFMLINKSMLTGLTAYLNRGDRKVDRWYRALAHRFAEFPDATAFANVNTQADLNAVSAQL